MDVPGVGLDHAFTTKLSTFPPASLPIPLPSNPTPHPPGGVSASGVRLPTGWDVAFLPLSLPSVGVCLVGGVSARWARPCSRNRVVDNVQHDDDDDDVASAMASSTLHNLNPNAERMGPQASLHMNLQAAKGLEDVLRTNLGPKGTVKMLVGGAGGA